MAVPRPPDDGREPRPELRTEPLVLLNPRVISGSSQTDEQHEGCLSFFDVRGMVPRPLQIEIDHLSGLLYTARRHDGTYPMLVAEYRGTEHAWTYARDPR
jgi:peptide deformylase